MKQVVIYRAFIIVICLCLTFTIFSPWIVYSLLYLFKDYAGFIAILMLIGIPIISLILSIIIGKFRKE